MTATTWCSVLPSRRTRRRSVIDLEGSALPKLRRRDDSMCGLFVQRYTWDEIQDLYELPEGPARNLQAHYNVAPTDPVEVVRPAAAGGVELVSMRWGFVPWWW